MERVLSRSATVLCYCSLPGLLWLWGLEFLLCLFCRFFLYILSASRGLWLKHPSVKPCLMKNVEEDKEDHPLCVGPVKIITLNQQYAKVLFKDLNPGIAMAIVRFKFSRKLYFCFVSVIRQKFNFSAFSEMAQNFWFWLHWMKRNYVFVLVDDKVSKFKSIQNWNWKFLLNFLEIAIKVIHFMYYLI